MKQNTGSLFSHCVMMSSCCNVLFPFFFLFFLNFSIQISEGLSFLHSGVKMVHGNLCPENIILNKSGSWKIMGFDFSISSTNASDAEVRP